MQSATDSYYRDYDDAEALLTELRDRYANTDFDWEAILSHSYSTLLPRLSDELTVIDIGCHLGVHTDALLALPGLQQVDCFEPQPRYVTHLRQRYRREPRVRVHDRALCNQRGQQRFVVNTTAPGESGLRERSFYNDQEAALSSLQVRCDRLDAWQFHQLHFIKIDTEGAEIDILKGAVKTIAEHRPLIALEFGIGGYDAYGYGPEDLLALADRHDYIVTDLFFNICQPAVFAERICSRFYWDYFLLPREHLDAVQAFKREGGFS